MTASVRRTRGENPMVMARMRSRFIEAACD
jgi:hypothetical protein